MIFSNLFSFLFFFLFYLNALYNQVARDDHEYYSERLKSKSGVYNKIRRTRYSQKLERVAMKNMESKKRKEIEIERERELDSVILDELTSDLNTD